MNPQDRAHTGADRGAVQRDTGQGPYAPKPKRSVGTVAVEDQAVLLDGSTGRLHLLDPIATTVWSALDGLLTVDELAAEVASAFAADAERVRADVDLLVRQLNEEGLLEDLTADAGTATDRVSVDPTSRLARRTQLSPGEPHFLREPPSS